MNKDLHDIDELFLSGLEGHEETPSAGVKDALDAALDKKEAEEYKKRFLIWKRAALLLLLLLAGFVLYESGIIKTSNGGQAAKNTSPVKNDLVKDENETAGADKDSRTTSTPGVSTRDEADGQKKDLQNPIDKKETNRMPGGPVTADKNIVSLKTVLPKNNRPVKKEDPVFSFTSSQPDKKTNDAAGYDTDLQIPKRGISPLDERISLAKTAKWLSKNIQLLSSIAFNHTPLTENRANNSKKKKGKSFKPFWMATAFASYDQAGYRLDSDEPSAITSIKFREAYEPSFSVGLLMTRQLAPRFGLQSGLVYSNSAIGMKPQKTYAFVDPTGDVAYKYITSSGYAYIKPGFGPQPAVGDSLTTAEAKHTIENISVPLVAKYTLLNKKISITPGAGVEANFITKANLEVDIEDPFNREIVVVRKLNGTKSFYWSFVADAEIKYNVNKKLSINIRPVYRTAISPITKNNVVETFPHSFGIGAGVTIKF